MSSGLTEREVTKHLQTLMDLKDEYCLFLLTEIRTVIEILE